MKQLKGKARKDFIKWYRKKHGKMLHLYFKELSLSEQFGIIQDFFDSVGIRSDVFFVDGFYYSNTETYTVIKYNKYKTRKKARKQAIKLATKQYNKKP